MKLVTVPEPIFYLLMDKFREDKEGSKWFMPDFGEKFEDLVMTDRNLFLSAKIGTDIIGWVNVSYSNLKTEAFIDYYIYPMHRGNHYGEEIVKTTMGWLRENTSVKALYGRVHHQNQRSKQVLYRANFINQGRVGDNCVFTYRL